MESGFQERTMQGRKVIRELGGILRGRMVSLEVKKYLGGSKVSEILIDWN